MAEKANLLIAGLPGFTPQVGRLVSMMNYVRSPTSGSRVWPVGGSTRRRNDVRGGVRVNNYFKWCHVLTHEVNHRGQIRWLRSRSPTAT